METQSIHRIDANNLNWVPADGHTKDLLDGATLMSHFGGYGTPYVKYDFTICEYLDGRIFPVHGMIKMDAVQTIEAAKEALIAYWNDLPDRSKIAWTGKL